jgi:hypothetical protein
MNGRMLDDENEITGGLLPTVRSGECSATHYVFPMHTVYHTAY